MSTPETPRLVLRQAVRADLDAFQTWAADAENVKYMSWGPNSREDTWSFLTECESAMSASPRMKYDFVAVLRETGRIIGSCGIYLDDARTAMLGWILHRDFHGMGLGTEISRALVKFGFEELGLHRMYANCYAENRASSRIMEKAGMRHEGRCVKSTLLRNSAPDDWRDIDWYAILKEEYFNDR